MSAVIWCGIVAVWAFILIPTWVRRGDHHWHRPLVSAASAGARVRQRIARGPQVSGGSAMARPARPARLAAGAVRRAPAGAARPSRPISVRRARRLAVLLALVLVTGVATLLNPGRAFIVQLLVDAVTVGYVLHLRKVALEHRRELARTRRSLAARRRWERSTADERTRRIQGWPAGQQPASVEDASSAGRPIAASSVPAQPVYERMRRQRVADDAGRAAERAAVTEPAMIDLTEPGTPLAVDLTAADAAEAPHGAQPPASAHEVPTEELVAAKAV